MQSALKDEEKFAMSAKTELTRFFLLHRRLHFLPQEIYLSCNPSRDLVHFFHALNITSLKNVLLTVSEIESETMLHIITVCTDVG